MADTSIEWTKRPGTRGETWNPTTGCSKVSPGCRSCYAEVLHKRLTAMGQAKYSEPFSVVRTHPDALDLPLRTRHPTTYFVNSMSDLFHADVPNEFIAAVFGVMAACPQHTFLILTKRAERLPEWFAWIRSWPEPQPGLRGRPVWWDRLRVAAIKAGAGVESSDPPALPWPLPNVWLGVSVESPDYEHRVGNLLATPAAVHFVSYEPALAGWDVSPWLDRGDSFPVTDEDADAPDGEWWGIYARVGATWQRRLPGLDWIIFGSESGRLARSPDVEWARSVRDQCQASGAAFFLKQLPGLRKGSKVPTPELDGRRWTEWPATDTSTNSPERQAAARPGMDPTGGAGATSSARAASAPCADARAQVPTGGAGDDSNTGGGAHGSPTALSAVPR